jgi:hypothetical protein
MLLSFSGGQIAEAHHKRPLERKDARGEVVKVEQPRSGCNGLYERKRMYEYAKKRYMRRTKPMTDGQAKYIRHVAFCLPTWDGTRWAFEKRDQWRAVFRRRLAYYRLTPFVCGNGTRWAIPCYIVACESGYSWSAYNSSSGARGPYQFLGWPVPWPVDSWEDKMAHHRMARDLYDGGNGRSHWVC